MKLLEESELTAKIEAELTSLYQSVDTVARPFLAAHEQVQKINRRVIKIMITGLLIYIFVPWLGAVLGSPIIATVAVVTAIVVWVTGITQFTRSLFQTELRKQAGQFSVTAHTVILEAVYTLAGFENPKLQSPITTIGNQLRLYGQQRPVSTDSTNSGINARALIDASELITEDANNFRYDDVMTSEWQGQTVTTAELHVSHTTGSGKNRHTKEIFKGLFLHLPTSLTASGKTFLSTDGDRDGFGHQSFWTKLTGNHEVAETIFEWNEFEDVFHVATNNPMEARYIFTPDFMHVIHDLWQNDKGNIRISVIGSDMYILCPTDNVEIYDTIKNLELQTIRLEAFAVAHNLVPLMRLLQVVGTRVSRTG